MATINEFLFSSEVSDQRKLEVIKSLTPAQVRATTSKTILRILNECKPKDYDRLYIDGDRRVGNNWNSSIEFIYEHNGRPYLMFYVQNTSTDWSESVSYDTFNNSNGYRGYCDYLHTSFTYDQSEVVEVIRCILAEYVWFSIERPQREQAERLASVSHYTIINPVLNKFYDELRCKYCQSHSDPRYKQYNRGEAAVKEYAKAHLEELYGKPKEELQSIYTKVFRAAM